MFVVSNTTVMADAAIAWFRFDFPVIPIVPGEKRPAVKRHPWLDDQSPEAISKYWTRFPTHEVGIIVPEGYVVLDADSPEAIEKLERIVASHNVIPNLVIETRRGVHHYYRLGESVYAPSDTHDSEKHADRIDVLGSGRQVIVPPSTGKTVKTGNAKRASELVVVDQTFIDSVFLMNDREAPRPPKSTAKLTTGAKQPCGNFDELGALLETLDPDCGYEDWTKVIMAIYHETGGSDEGLEFADTWSRRGSKYKDRLEIEAKWRSFREVANPVTKATLVMMAKDNGADLEAVMAASVPQFDKCETIVIKPPPSDSRPVISKQQGTVFDRFSLTGMADQLEKDALEQVPVLGQFSLLGQTTVLCAEGNTGKTLIALKLLTESITAGRIDPARTYFLNMDDDYQGLITKLKLAEEFGFHMLAEGYKGFTAESFISLIKDINRRDDARGVVLFLDTLKKFINVMQKSDCRDFNTHLREFSSKGGTLIALAHVNKKRDSNGRPVFAGVSDLKDDFDCMFLLWLISERSAREKVVMIEKEKARGPVVEKVCYGYVSGKDISYNEMLLSVTEVEEDQIVALEQAEAIRSDAEVIDAVIACINEGINTKMVLAEAAAKRSGASKRSVLQLIDKYTGDDLTKHRWTFVRGERGKQIFSALEVPRDK